MKDNLARKLSSPEPTTELATVVAVVGPRLRVRSERGEVEARRAASCLLAPGLGDEVLVVHHERGSHVLAILERDASAPAAIAIEGDLQLSSVTGRVTVTGEQGVDLRTPGEAVIAAATVRLSADQAEANVGAARYVGDTLHTHVERMKTVAKSIETVADRLVARLERAYRFVARNDTLRAEYVDVQARAAFHVKSEAAVVNGATLTKLDGSQIHLG